MDSTKHPLDLALSRGDDRIEEDLDQILGSAMPTPPPDESELWGGTGGRRPATVPGKSYPEIKNENPRHRLICALAAQGLLPQEIAKAVNVGVGTVRTTLAQPWARARIREFIDQSAEDSIQQLFSTYAGLAVDTLVKNMTSEKATANAQISAAKEILDRHLGKALLRTENTNRNISVSAEGDELDRELDRLRAELSALEKN
jgi:hypothetical protein